MKNTKLPKLPNFMEIKNKIEMDLQIIFSKVTNRYFEYVHELNDIIMFFVGDKHREFKIGCDKVFELEKMINEHTNTKKIVRIKENGYNER